MGFLIQYIAQYSPWIYAICGLVALYHIYKTWQVRSERRQALFSLEREKALRELFSILFVSILILFIMGITYFSSEILAPEIESQSTIRPISTSTPIVIQSPPTPLPTVQIPTETSIITATIATPIPTPVEVVIEEAVPDTPTPVPAPVVTSVCPDARAQLNAPPSGTTVSGLISFSGSAIHEQFQFYKLEYAPGANAQEGFVYLSGGNSPVTNGLLGQFESANLTNGNWTIRLVVVDTTGNFPPPCGITLNVQN
ncbi:MAG: hypothetical protein AAF702_06015 [Chloroflexota bacterium]